MTGYTRHDLPCDIIVFAGKFAGQPAAFAHLLTACPELDLEACGGDPRPRRHAAPGAL